MKYKKIKNKAYNLHMIQTDKFKTITVKIIFRNPILRDEVTLNVFLRVMLIYATKNYPTKNAFTKFLEDCYGIDVFSGSSRIGNFYSMEIGVKFLDEIYTEKGMVEKSIKILNDIIFNPNVADKQFNEDAFSIVKEDGKNAIESLKEDPRALSKLKMLEAMDVNANYAINTLGYMDDLNKITPSNLYEHYLKIIDQSLIDIFVIGDIDFNEIKYLIEDNFPFKKRKVDKLDCLIKHEKFKRKVDEIIEPDKNLEQSKLSIGCKIEDLDQFDLFYTLTIYTSILGSGTNSKFFKNTREKLSLCYYCSGVPSKPDNLFVITSGISKKNYNKALDSIKKEMKDMTLGNFDIEDVKKAKSEYLASLDNLEDSSAGIMANYYSMELLGIDDVKTRRKKIMTVTFDDIKRVSKKIHLDTIYLLGGEK